MISEVAFASSVKATLKAQFDGEKWLKNITYYERVNLKLLRIAQYLIGDN